jgi:hypothetical protein
MKKFKILSKKWDKILKKKTKKNTKSGEKYLIMSKASVLLTSDKAIFMLVALLY